MYSIWVFLLNIEAMFRSGTTISARTQTRWQQSQIEIFWKRSYALFYSELKCKTKTYIHFRFFLQHWRFFTTKSAPLKWRGKSWRREPENAQPVSCHLISLYLSPRCPTAGTFRQLSHTCPPLSHAFFFFSYHHWHNTLLSTLIKVSVLAKCLACRQLIPHPF